MPKKAPSQGKAGYKWEQSKINCLIIILLKSSFEKRKIAAEQKINSKLKEPFLHGSAVNMCGEEFYDRK